MAFRISSLVVGLAVLAASMPNCVSDDDANPHGRGGREGDGGAAGAAGHQAGGRAAGEGGFAGQPQGGEGGEAATSGAAGDTTGFFPPELPNNVGGQRTLAILLSHDPQPGVGPADPTSIRGVMSRLQAVDANLREFSYGKAWLVPSVTNVYAGAIPGCTRPFDPENSNAIVRYAIARADPDVDLTAIDRIVIMLHPDLFFGCDINPNGNFYQELASSDGPFSAGVMTLPNVLFDSPMDDRVDTHEFIHTLGTGHVSRLECYDTPARGQRVPYSYTLGVRNESPDVAVCPVQPEMSQLDIMGDLNQVTATVNAALKKQFGWLEESNIVTTRAGTYSLLPLDAPHPVDEPLMIQIPIPYTTSYYVLEHRSQSLYGPGVYVYLAIQSRPPRVLPYLLETEPFGMRAPLHLGVNTIDAAMALTVDVTASSAAGATFTIGSAPGYVTQCTDGVWNGVSYGYDHIDAADYSCQIGSGLSEIEPAPSCFDSLDNDGDGPMDQLDPECNSGGIFQEQSNAE